MKITKEIIEKVRSHEGFPSGSVENMQNLSDIQFYTPFPNPFIKDFIQQHGKTYNEDEDTYNVEPYTFDINEDKHDLLYNIHSYHTKVPPKAIKSYIEHYTAPDDIVLDVFCGSGMTGLAAQLSDKNGGSRKAILSDLSVYASFISANYNTPNSPGIIEDLREMINDIERKFGIYYETKHNDYINGKINYVVWSCIYYCSNCGYEFIYYDLITELNIKSTQSKFKCKKCNVELERSKLKQKRNSDYDEILNSNTEVIMNVPVLINYSVGKRRYNKKPDQYDLEKLVAIKKEEFGYVPLDRVNHGDETERLFRAGITHIKQLYPIRTLFFLSRFWGYTLMDKKKLFLLTSAMPKLTVLNRFMPEHGSRALVGPRTGTFYLPPLYVENDVIGQLRFQLKKLENLRYDSGDVIISTQSATDLSNISDNTIDYIFIDPPFGSNIAYSELNHVPESWLGIFTSSSKEAIVSKYQRKSVLDYQNLMTQSFKELNRVLKPGRWITVEFHNSKNSIWNSIQESISVSGFVIADVRTLDKEKKTINQYNAQGCVDQDLVISAYKPKESFQKAFKSHQGTVQTAWDFVRQHLEKLPVVVAKNNKIEVVVERQAFLLFDRMIAYHIVNGILVPLDAADFYKGLDEKFIKRDGMYFLHDQVNEYDNARIKTDVEDIQFSLFVSNEKTAIAWLYQQLIIPQTYAEIQPKFMQEIRSIEKHEELPELSSLLEDNFLKEDSGKWYIPDTNKAVDVMRLREKKLVKEFEEYLNIPGKLKKFRTEAVRAGFAKLWKDRNYDLIVKTAERLPEEVVQEDDKILMYYDISLSRLG